MKGFEIIGGQTLSGCITPQGSKNEALQVIAATLLTDHEILIHNIPNIIDVKILINILKNLGVKINNISSNSYSFKSDNINLNYLYTDEYIKYSSMIRGSILIAGPLLTRYKFTRLINPGGDKIGRRKIDIHLIGFEKLGAKIYFYKNIFEINSEKLIGNYLILDEISVTGTANIIMAAVLAYGETIIYNAACEPYIVQLCKMLCNMGAKIYGIKSNYLTIRGVDYLTGTCHYILPDIIEIGSFIGLAAVTNSLITIKDTYIDDLHIILSIFRKLGIIIEIDNNNITILGNKHYKISSFIDGSILNIYDSPWPGLTPDLISIIIVTAIQAKGTVLIHQKMFESRLFFIDKLIDMGSKIILCDPHRVVVIGINKKYNLNGIEMTSPDIRAGVALLIAALSSNGKSIIKNIEQIDRGYETIDTKINSLGGKIKRIIL